MQITKIEIDGAGGHLTIERDKARCEIRIDSIIRNPAHKQQAWKTWTFAATGIKQDELYVIAALAQARTDGQRGTNSMVHDYMGQIERVIG